MCIEINLVILKPNYFGMKICQCGTSHFKKPKTGLLKFTLESKISKNFELSSREEQLLIFVPVFINLVIVRLNYYQFFARCLHYSPLDKNLRNIMAHACAVCTEKKCGLYFSIEIFLSMERLSPNVNTTPITAMGCRQCLPHSVVQLAER